MKEPAGRYSVAIIIPAHNEESVIDGTIRSLDKIIPAEHIYVVDDCSTDQTRSIALNHTPHVLSLRRKHGKARALNRAIRYFGLAGRYRYIAPLDADTRMSESFIPNIIRQFRKDRQRQIVCVVGRILGRMTNPVTAYRMWEYEVAQSIHKRAQAVIGSVVVCPGCATVYRSEILMKYPFPAGTMTEDMDLTFLLHRRAAGKIVYTGSATVMTQDPRTVRDFCRQLQRWYTGFWQNVRKHKIPWGGQLLDAEVGMLAIEGLFNGLLMLALTSVLPYILLKRPTVLIVPAVFDMFLFMLPTVIITALRRRSYRMIIFLPHFYLLRFLSSLIFLNSFMSVVIASDLRAKWRKLDRYAFREDKEYSTQ
ncbi:hypothetical protein A2Z33_07315 [Candidatus Gottesmanbacteria bacterium RBG_16_52_11]|uniref:Glycosyltransferase 2-like domain-containing protein n=1 Tax=Candidatus Gottesmanbacteria bacterium RBG_16_52_11 TaxID=1798374 RepID=A0A1F5YY09_9BACT|nr:MAG: hypothetical protein A2Z33_07315 [Candidatus Gottesmanbacteria bacterium RBG_16_52_11]